MKLYIYLAIFTLPLKLFSQNMRDVIVLSDTTFEVNSTKTSSTITHPFIKNGLRINVMDTPFRVTMIAEKSENILNGVFILFHIKTNMPAEKGKYVDGEEDGEWFYWNEKGILLMRKIWKKGKLLKTIKCR